MIVMVEVSQLLAGRMGVHNFVWREADLMQVYAYAQSVAVAKGLPMA